MTYRMFFAALIGLAVLLPAPVHVMAQADQDAQADNEYRVNGWAARQRIAQL